MGKHAPSASKTRAFLFSSNPNKGTLTPLFYTLLLPFGQGMRDPGKGGMFAKSRQRRKISSFLYLVGFSKELISVLLIIGWYSRRSSSPRAMKDEKMGGREKKQTSTSISNQLRGDRHLPHT